MIASFAPSRLTINLAAFTANYKLFQGMGGGADVAGVIKADAYGIGAVQAFQALYEAGAREFFVATPYEGTALKAHEDSSVYILGGVYSGAEADYVAAGIIPVLNSLDQIERWSALARKTERRLPAIVHFDTGMNRLGLERMDLQTLVGRPELLEALDLRAIMSHFACSDEKDHPMNKIQAEKFDFIARHFPTVRKSLCNSSGIFRNETWHYDLLRPGYALYGGNPTPEDSNPMRRVVDWSVQILQTRLGKKGESAGYSATRTLDKDTRLATVSLGYADGFLRAGSNRAALFWNGHPCPILGRVSMDLIIVDIGGVQDSQPQAGDWLEVLGPHQSVDDLASACGTIGYEILTSLRGRAHRTYIGSE
jgi:alanine racemase